MPYTLNEPLLKGSSASLIIEYWLPSLEPLIAEEAYSSVQKLGQQIPSEVTSLRGYELLLCAKEPSADFLFCVHDPALCKQVLPDYLPDHQKWLNMDAYAAIKDLSMDWVDKDSRLEN